MYKQILVWYHIQNVVFLQNTAEWCNINVEKWRWRSKVQWITWTWNFIDDLKLVMLSPRESLFLQFRSHFGSSFGGVSSLSGVSPFFFKMLPAAFRPCLVCEWVNQVLPEADASEPALRDPLHPDMDIIELVEDPDGRAMRYQTHLLSHQKPSPMWLEILQTQKLCAGFFSESELPDWFRFPTRGMTPRQPSSKGFPIRTFHWTPVEHLCGRYDGIPQATGILNDGCLLYGMPHGDAAGVGVCCYTGNPTPWRRCQPSSHWCLLELEMAPRLEEISATPWDDGWILKPDDRHASVGTPCTDCKVVAVHFRTKELPLLMVY